MSQTLLAEINGKGNCLTTKVEVFFPEGVPGTGELRRKELAAKAICIGCPVINECLQLALENNEYGIWGGTTMEERKSLRRGNRRKQLKIR